MTLNLSYPSLSSQRCLSITSFDALLPFPRRNDQLQLTFAMNFTRLLMLFCASLVLLPLAAGFGIQHYNPATITAPPSPEASYQAFITFGKRDSNNATVLPSCSFGACGATCLEQGAFCCNPGGSRVRLAVSLRFTSQEY